MTYDNRKKYFKLLRIVTTRPRLFSCALAGIVTNFLMPTSFIQRETTRLIISWNVGTWIYLLTTLVAMFWSSHENVKAKAIQQDEGRIIILISVVLSSLICLGSTVTEISVAKGTYGIFRNAHIVLGGLSILSSWALIQVIFAIHYAHDYYISIINNKIGGLDFPGDADPDYSDFLYFSCVIGTSAQTADVSFTNRSMRRIGLAHCVLAFFFNTTVLALGVNIASGMF